MKVIILAAEYLADPIFCPDVDSMGHISVHDLPISKPLRDGLTEWNNEYQSTFNNEYPPDSGFATSKLAEAHQEKGKLLAEQLQRELGADYLVEYRY